MLVERLVRLRGHVGPWRYVEAIEVWREVRCVGVDSLTVAARWHTGPGYNDGVAGSAYLLCWDPDSDDGHCTERVDLPVGITLDWD